ncbi:unnamed protein product [Ectocarpus sp. 12 AP-2014]
MQYLANRGKLFAWCISRFHNKNNGTLYTGLSRLWLECPVYTAAGPTLKVCGIFSLFLGTADEAHSRARGHTHAFSMLDATNSVYHVTIVGGETSYLFNG